jgi:signal peptidase I
MIIYLLQPNLAEVTTPWFIALLIALLIPALFFWYYRVGVRIKQQALNSTLAYTNLENNSYFVYLRSFRTAGRLLIRNTYGGWTERSLVGSYWDIEFALTAAIAQEGLLIAIGDKRETVGAAKVIASDDEWKAKFFDLCSRAKAIFVLPDDSDSLVWEMKQITECPTLGSKAFFLMPPRRPFLFRALGYIANFLGWVIGHRGLWWRRTQTALANNGLFIPDFRWEGAIFKMNEHGKVSYIESFDWLREQFITKLLEAKYKTRICVEKRWFEKWPITWTVLQPGFLLPVLTSLVIALLVKSFAFQLFNIPSGSNEPTLLIGDYIAVSKYSYGYSRYSGLLPPMTGRIFGREPQRGDMVVFRLPKNDSVDYIKRVVGLPSDRVQMIDGLLHINGQPVKRERVDDFVGESSCGDGGISRIKRWRETLPNGVSYYTLDCQKNRFLDDTPVYTVPDGRLFMMGDNRDNSTDSRMLSQVGYVPFENLLGRAQIIFFSVGNGEPAWHFWSWPWSVRWSRLFHSIE